MLYKRRSIRRYSDRDISDEALHEILRAGMSAPSAVCKAPARYIVVRDREQLCLMADGNGPSADLLRQAKVGVLVCGDMEATYEKGRDYWIIDAAAACENMLLAATAMGIGSCWLGTWPQLAKLAAQHALFDLPENIVPHSILAFGYPADENELELGSRCTYDEAKVHWEKW